MARAAAQPESDWAGVVRAGRVLFGARAEAVIAGGAWRRELKRAYRRRVLETHPDRARSLGREEADLAREFQAVVEAYRILLAAPERRPVAAPRSAPATRPVRTERASPKGAAPKPRPAPANGRRAGVAARAAVIPARRVRLGEYLYYSRLVPFEALIEAIAWQRAQRPRVGRIAVECGFLTQAEVLEVMERRRRDGALSVPFAEYATRIGLLTPFARLAVLGHQARLQRRIGRFFVERGWIGEEELEAAQAGLRAHNASHAGR